MIQECFEGAEGSGRKEVGGKELIGKGLVVDQSNDV